MPQNYCNIYSIVILYYSYSYSIVKYSRGSHEHLIGLLAVHKQLGDNRDIGYLLLETPEKPRPEPKSTIE